MWMCSMPYPPGIYCSVHVIPWEIALGLFGSLRCLLRMSRGYESRIASSPSLTVRIVRSAFLLANHFHLFLRLSPIITLFDSISFKSGQHYLCFVSFLPLSNDVWSTPPPGG